MIADFLMRDCEPLFLNEGATRAELELKKLQALKYVVVDEDKKRLAQDIRLARAGVAGEKRIVFELRNSHYPLIFIHDLQCISHANACVAVLHTRPEIRRNAHGLRADTCILPKWEALIGRNLV